MVPFAVYSAFETFQFHVQDGGSSQDVNNSKFAPKPPGENGAKTQSHSQSFAWKVQYWIGSMELVKFGTAWTG